MYVDNRKNANLTTACLESGKTYQSTCLEEHSVTVGDLGKYLSHFSVEDGKGSSIVDGIYSAIKGINLRKT